MFSKKSSSFLSKAKLLWSRLNQPEPQKPRPTQSQTAPSAMPPRPEEQQRLLIEKLNERLNASLRDHQAKVDFSQKQLRELIQNHQQSSQKFARISLGSMIVFLMMSMALCAVSIVFSYNAGQLAESSVKLAIEQRQEIIKVQEHQEKLIEKLSLFITRLTDVKEKLLEISLAPAVPVDTSEQTIDIQEEQAQSPEKPQIVEQEAPQEETKPRTYRRQRRRR